MHLKLIAIGCLLLACFAGQVAVAFSVQDEEEFDPWDDRELDFPLDDDDQAFYYDGPGGHHWPGHQTMDKRPFGPLFRPSRPPPDGGRFYARKRPFGPLFRPSRPPPGRFYAIRKRPFGPLFRSSGGRYGRPGRYPRNY